MAKELAISVYAQATNSVHGELFNEEVLNGKGISTEVHFLAASDILKAIAKDPKGIGYRRARPGGRRSAFRH